jgi:hypothetical protein
LADYVTQHISTRPAGAGTVGGEDGCFLLGQPEIQQSLAIAHSANVGERQKIYKRDSDLPAAHV